VQTRERDILDVPSNVDDVIRAQASNKEKETQPLFSQFQKRSKSVYLVGKISLSLISRNERKIGK
jgi:hypothetical protein